MNIQQTVEFFDAGIALKEAIKISRQNDGKVNFPGDLLNFIGFLTALPAALDGLDEIPKELDDLDQAEIDVLTERFGEIVADERYQRVFKGLAIAGDAINEIVSQEIEEAVTRPSIDTISVEDDSISTK